ncbi:MAG: DUF6504 family protein [Thermaerobacter sp.]|nr:DUF6504 family protein [Thermaerobacter sp.]
MKPLSRIWATNRVPERFLWNRREVVIVRVIDYWRDVGEWWRNEPELWFWRVEGRDRGIYELACDPQRNQWWMYHVYD